MVADARIERAKVFYQRSVIAGENDGLTTADRELDALEAELALARGRIRHGRFLARRAEDETEEPGELAAFERALELFRALGDIRGEGESLFWIGAVHQVVRRDHATAVPILERSRDLATKVGDREIAAEALRHLGIAEHAAGRLGAAREHLTRSSEIRREAGLPAGVAANMVGLGYITAAEGRHDDALSILDEAHALALAHGAHNILLQIEEAQAHVRQIRNRV
ncbi:tetratricopeptide repeat protein [Embleya scabrispora]|uniref:tetratricopeptide repeat protein n=1 Tax=Embleya scabrispora TaxID=159449 RepID=UPI00039AFAA7|nr:tetratricopeptide repeat protein [Embleya scabrispora]MYS85329.1 tetratricopeptide repeat protein [Streptomyces sp. SID5474]